MIRESDVRCAASGMKEGIRADEHDLVLREPQAYSQPAGIATLNNGFSRRSLVRATGVALALLAQATAAVPAAVSLCGHTASSQRQLYFDLGKSPFAHVLRATERETILEDGASGVLWTFVVAPVSLVACRSQAKPEELDTQCDGETALCASLIARLKADPRAQP